MIVCFLLFFFFFFSSRRRHTRFDCDWSSDVCCSDLLAMTAEERRRPEIINGSRRSRIAAGSGTTVQQVNKLLTARKQMRSEERSVGKECRSRWGAYH